MKREEYKEKGSDNGERERIVTILHGRVLESIGKA